MRLAKVKICVVDFEWLWLYANNTIIKLANNSYMAKSVDDRQVEQESGKLKKKIWTKMSSNFPIHPWEHVFALISLLRAFCALMLFSPYRDVVDSF